MNTAGPKATRKTHTKKITSSYETQDSLEASMRPGTFWLCDVDFNVSVGNHKKDLLHLGFSQPLCPISHK